MALEREKNKLVIEKCQSFLTELLKDDDNKYCVDCDAKSPRWASWNIGIFLCIRCAGIHRNLGVHISRVKSVNLDSWTPQQVACIEQMGNSRARAVYEANLQDNFRRPQSDSSLEQFIRAKYETKKYIAREWIPPELPHPTWDIELEKQLKRKKDKKHSAGSIEFPAQVKNTVIKSSGISPKPLPKAPGGRNNSPSMNHSKRLSGKSKSGETPAKNSGSVDLLGLDVSSPTSAINGGSTKAVDTNDIFGDFLAAPSLPSTKSDLPKNVITKDVKEEESNFFNQKQPEAANEKMSKDSILALYSQTPSQPHMLGGNGGGSFMGGRMPLASSGYTIPPQQATVIPNMQQNAMFYQRAGSNIPATAGAQSQYCAPSGGPAILYPAMPTGVQLSAANPFSQMQAQMGNMTLGGMPLSQQPNHMMMGPTNVIRFNSSPTNPLWQ